MSSDADAASQHDEDAVSYASQEPEDPYEEKFEGQYAIGNLLQTAFEDVSEGTFAGMGLLRNMPSPGLFVHGVGHIGLPLSERDQRLLVHASELAPFGKGNDLTMDEEVRRTFQIDARRIAFANPEWSHYFCASILPQACQILGVNAQHVGASLYKMLLYEPLGHFKFHRDTEKEPNHFATLTLVLPSRFIGGSVSVKHDSRLLNFNLAPHTIWNAAYTVLYTDVEHQVEPVTSGMRLALTYNLVYTSAPLHAIPRAPQSNAQLVELRQRLVDWRETARQQKKLMIAHLLEHQYSQVGLSFQTLKGNDRAKIRWLQEIARDLNLSIYIAQCTITHTGIQDADWQEPEVEFQSVTNQLGPVGELNNLKAAVEDLTPQFNVDEEEVDEESDQGYQGNYPGDTTHRYHRSAVLLWLQDHDITWRIDCSGPKLAETLLRSATANLKSMPCQRTFSAVQHTILSVLATRHVDASIEALVEAAISVPTTQMATFVLQATKIFECGRGLPLPLWLQLQHFFGFVLLKPFLSTYFDVLLNDTWQIWVANVHFKPRSTELEQAIELAGQLEPLVEQEDQFWLSDQRTKLTLATMDKVVANVPAFVALAESIGFARFQEVFLRNLRFKSHSGAPPIDEDLALELADYLSRSNILAREAYNWKLDLIKRETTALDQHFPYVKGPETSASVTRTVRVLLLCGQQSNLTMDILRKILPSLEPSTDANMLEYAVVPILDALRHCLLQEPYTSWILQWRTKTPSNPNYSPLILPMVRNDMLDHFLSSRETQLFLRFTQSIRNSANWSLSQLKEAGAITVKTVRDAQPQMLVISKTGFHKGQEQLKAAVTVFHQALGPQLLDLTNRRLVVPMTAPRSNVLANSSNIKRDREEHDNLDNSLKRAKVVIKLE